MTDDLDGEIDPGRFLACPECMYALYVEAGRYECHGCPYSVGVDNVA